MHIKRPKSVDQAGADEGSMPPQAATAAVAGEVNEAQALLDESVAMIRNLEFDGLYANVMSLIGLHRKPSVGARLTIEALCVLTGVKPTMVNDPEGGPKKVADYWDAGKKLFSNNNRQLVLDSIINFDYDNIPENIINDLQPYIQNVAFTPTTIESTSELCSAICQWVHATYKYHHVAKEVKAKPTRAQPLQRRPQPYTADLRLLGCIVWNSESAQAWKPGRQIASGLARVRMQQAQIKSEITASGAAVQSRSAPFDASSGEYLDHIVKLEAALESQMELAQLLPAEKAIRLADARRTMIRSLEPLLVRMHAARQRRASRLALHRAFSSEMHPFHVSGATLARHQSSSGGRDGAQEAPQGAERQRALSRHTVLDEIEAEGDRSEFFPFASIVAACPGEEVFVVLLDKELFDGRPDEQEHPNAVLCQSEHAADALMGWLQIRTAIDCSALDELAQGRAWRAAWQQKCELEIWLLLQRSAVGAHNAQETRTQREVRRDGLALELESARAGREDIAQRVAQSEGRVADLHAAQDAEVRRIYLRAAFPRAGDADDAADAGRVSESAEKVHELEAMLREAESAWEAARSLLKEADERIDSLQAQSDAGDQAGVSATIVTRPGGSGIYLFLGVSTPNGTDLGEEAAASWTDEVRSRAQALSSRAALVHRQAATSHTEGRDGGRMTFSEATLCAADRVADGGGSVLDEEAVALLSAALPSLGRLGAEPPRPNYAGDPISAITAEISLEGDLLDKENRELATLTQRYEPPHRKQSHRISAALAAEEEATIETETDAEAAPKPASGAVAIATLQSLLGWMHDQIPAGMGHHRDTRIRVALADGCMVDVAAEQLCSAHAMAGNASREAEELRAMHRLRDQLLDERRRWQLGPCGNAEPVSFAPVDGRPPLSPSGSHLVVEGAGSRSTDVSGRDANQLLFPLVCSTLLEGDEVTGEATKLSIVSPESLRAWLWSGDGSLSAAFDCSGGALPLRRWGLLGSQPSVDELHGADATREELMLMAGHAPHVEEEAHSTFANALRAPGALGINAVETEAERELRRGTEAFDTALPTNGAWPVLPEDVIARDQPLEAQLACLSARVAKWGGDGTMPEERQVRRRRQILRRFKAGLAPGDEVGGAPRLPAASFLASFVRDDIGQEEREKNTRRIQIEKALIVDARDEEARERRLVIWPQDGRWIDGDGSSWDARRPYVFARLHAYFTRKYGAAAAGALPLRLQGKHTGAMWDKP